MAHPFFYYPSSYSKDEILTLDEDSSKHIIQVLRMNKGERLNLTDGNGNLAETTILDDHKKKCVVKIDSTDHRPLRRNKIGIAVSLLKNTSRFEWMLEKLTEIGVSSIYPLICARTEKQQFRIFRMNNILISAMLQSQQPWLPVLHEPDTLENILGISYEEKLIAHCIPVQKKNLTASATDPSSSKIILIGPEGDFTAGEIESALKHQFAPVALGETRLRSETAAIVAAALLCNC